MHSLFFSEASPDRFVDRASKNMNGKHKLDKKQACYYCHKTLLKIGRHLQECHKKEMEVQKIAALKERKNPTYLTELEKLKCLGNFNHNIKVLATDQPSCHLIVAKRPTKLRLARDFTPCPHCYGFYVVDELWRHILRCPVYIEASERGITENNRSSVIASSRLVLEGAVLQSRGVGRRFVYLKSKVLVNARMDSLYNIFVSDELIMGFGSVLLKKLGPGRGHDITQRMRQLARLLITLNERSGNRSSVSTFLQIISMML